MSALSAVLAHVRRVQLGRLLRALRIRMLSISTPIENAIAK